MEKSSKSQPLVTRQPLQERSRHKVKLIFEATIRLIEKKGLDALTTNGIAASAGVSIGTLYQFFPNREAILSSLAEREMAAMSKRIRDVMDDPSIATTDGRMLALVQAVAASYGGRQTAYRLVMQRSLMRGGSPLEPLLAEIIAHLSRQRETGAIKKAFDRDDAFVLAHALAGVLRAMTREDKTSPPKDQIATSLTKLVTRFI